MEKLETWRIMVEEEKCCVLQVGSGIPWYDLAHTTNSCLWSALLIGWWYSKHEVTNESISFRWLVSGGNYFIAVQKNIENRCFSSLFHGIYSLLLLGISSGTGSQAGMPLSQWESWHRGNREGNFKQGWGQGRRAGGTSKVKDQIT